MIIHTLPRRDTQRYQLLELIALSGDFPAELLSRLPGGSTYKESVVKSLKREGLIRTFYRDHLRTYRLTAKAKAQLMAEQPDRFAFYLEGNSDTNLLKGEITRRLRLYQIAAVYVNMKLADIRIFRDLKPEVFSPSGSPVCHIEEPAFYSSREVKDLGMEAAKLRGSRMAGVLLAPSGIFPVYNSGSSLTRWENRSELRVKALLQMELCQRRLHRQYQMDDVRALLFGDSMELAYELLVGGREKKQNYFILDGNYEHFYYLTNNQHGETLLRLLCNPSMTAELNRILAQGFREQIPDWHIENDAIDRNGEPVLFGYFFDLPRIARFNAALGLQDKGGTLVCFDFQYDVLHRYCTPSICFQTIDFTKFNRRFFPSENIN